MWRKGRRYPSYRTLLKHNVSKMMLETKLCVLYFVPDKEFHLGGFKLTKRGFGGELDRFYSFPNTRNGYTQALAECEAWIDSQLDIIEREFYEGKD